MDKRKQKQVLALVVSAMVVYLVFRFLFSILFPVVLALLVGKILMPAVTFLRKKCHFPKTMSILLPVVVFFVGIGAAVYYFVGAFCGQLVSVVQKIPYYQEIVSAELGQICSWCDGILFVKDGTVFSYLSMRINGMLNQVSSKGFSQITLGAFAFLKKMLGWAGTFGIIMIVTCMIVKDMDSLKEKYRESIFYEDMQALLSPLTKVGFAYGKAQLILISMVAGVCIVGFWVTGSSYALLFGIFVAVFDAFPFVGSGLILVPAAVLALLRGNIFSGAVYLTTYLLCQLLRQFLEPKLIGDKVGIHPFFIMLSVYFGIECFGIWGVILGPAALVLIPSLANWMAGEK